jgi:hypothetical protein
LCFQSIVAELMRRQPQGEDTGVSANIYFEQKWCIPEGLNTNIAFVVMWCVLRQVSKIMYLEQWWQHFKEIMTNFPFLFWNSVDNRWPQDRQESAWICQQTPAQEIPKLWRAQDCLRVLCNKGSANSKMQAAAWGGQGTARDRERGGMGPDGMVLIGDWNVTAG